MNDILKNIPTRSIRIIKIILYIFLFSYLIASIYISFTYNTLVIRIGIFTFFIFLKKWAILGLVILFLSWLIENLHIQILKNKIKEFEEGNN